MKKALFTGLPNSGKTHLFNELTKSYDIEANYAYTTMDLREKKLSLSGEEWIFTDSPGFHGLYIHSEEELLLREYIYSNRPDVLIHCIDSGRLRQGLLLAMDLSSLQIPMAIIINHVDESASSGDFLHSETLAKELSIPVVEVYSFNVGDSTRIKEATLTASLPKVSLYSDKIEGILSTFMTHHYPYDHPFKRATSLLILQEDETVTPLFLGLTEGEHSQLRKRGQELRYKEFSGDFNMALLQQRQEKVESISQKIIDKRKKRDTTLPDKLAAMSRHPIYGIPLLLLTLAVGYLLVVNLAGAMEGVLTHYIFDPLIQMIERRISSLFWRDLLVGEYGLISLGIVAALATVLPVLTVFFFFFAIIEDTGYLPNLMVLLRRVGEKIGLSGKSLMPLLLGFGCKTMATLSTKSISSRREKIIAIFLIGFAIPCSAQMGLNMAILGKAGVVAFIIALVFLVAVEMGAGIVLNKILPQQDYAPFIQELPPLRRPRLKALLRKTRFRIVNFLKESLLVFMIAAICLYLLDLTGALLAMKNFVSPIVVNWLGLPIDMVEGLLLILARNEAGAGYILRMANAGELSIRQTILAVVLTTMFVPCFANMVAMVRESGKRAGILMIVAINISSLLLAGGLNFFIQLVWKGAN